MQYIIGFLSALVFVYLLVQIQDRYDILSERLELVRSSQSRNHELINKHMPKENKKPERQSSRHEQTTNIRVIIMDNQAYWIKDNVFYTADILRGNVDKETTRRVDTMTMDKVQLDKMIFIIDKLKEEAFNDRWGAGN